MQRCVSVEHPPICGVLPHYLGGSLQQQVHSVLNENVTTENRYMTISCCVTWRPYWSRAVSFLMFLMLGSVPESSSCLTHSRWPYWAAQCSTVSLSPLVRFTFNSALSRDEPWKKSFRLPGGHHQHVPYSPHEVITEQKLHHLLFANPGCRSRAGLRT